MVVAFAEVGYTGRPGIGAVLSCHMVGDEIDYHFQAGAVCAFYQCFEFGHAVGYVFSQIRIDIVVIGDCVRTSGMAFDYMRIIFWNAERCVVGVVRMFDYTGVPDVCGPEVFDFLEYT